MAYARARRHTGGSDYWPGFVDAMATLLLVMTFLLSVFMIAQYFVTQEVSGKDTALKRLTRQIAQLTELLALEKGQKKSLEEELSALSASLASTESDRERLSGLVGIGTGRAEEAEARANQLGGELEGQRTITNEALAKVELLNQQILALRRQIDSLAAALDASEQKAAASKARIEDLGARLNVALARQVEELKAYRSDFFGRLRQLLEKRRDVRVVGDRFVFESEVLFPTRFEFIDRRRSRSAATPCQRDPPDRAHDSGRCGLGAPGGWAHGHSPDQHGRVSVQLGIVVRTRPIGGAISGEPGRVAGAPRGRRLR